MLTPRGRLPFPIAQKLRSVYAGGRDRLAPLLPPPPPPPRGTPPRARPVRPSVLLLSMLCVCSSRLADVVFAMLFSSVKVGIR